MQDTLLFSTKLTFPWGLSYVSPSPQSKGRFYEITDVGLANMLNLTWKYVEKEKKKENLFFFLMLCFICFFNLEHVSSWYPYLMEGGGGEGGLQRRPRVLKRGGVGWGGGHLPPSHTHTPTQILQNALELFVGRSKPLRNNHRV